MAKSESPNDNVLKYIKSNGIKFVDLKDPSKVQLRIFNSVGELVETLVDQELGSGTHEIIFDTSHHRSLASGIYYYNLLTGESSQTKGMILLKWFYFFKANKFQFQIKTNSHHSTNLQTENKIAGKISL